MKIYEYMELTKGSSIIGKRYNVDHEYHYLAKGFGNWGEDAQVCQHCICGKCGTSLISWAKNAECPKCGKDCYLT